MLLKVVSCKLNILSISMVFCRSASANSTSQIYTVINRSVELLASDMDLESAFRETEAQIQHFFKCTRVAFWLIDGDELFLPAEVMLLSFHPLH